MMPRPELDMSYMTGRTLVVGTPNDDDGAGSSAGGSTKDKGRGSYKCGRVRSLVVVACPVLERYMVSCAVFPCVKSMHLTVFVVLVVVFLLYALGVSQCGVPKKGHVCPYQPKLKRRADEPPPELRNAAVQVEMDEVRAHPSRFPLPSPTQSDRIGAVYLLRCPLCLDFAFTLSLFQCRWVFVR